MGKISIVFTPSRPRLNRDLHGGEPGNEEPIFIEFEMAIVQVSKMIMQVAKLFILQQFQIQTLFKTCLMRFALRPICSDILTPNISNLEKVYITLQYVLEQPVESP